MNSSLWGGPAAEVCALSAGMECTGTSCLLQLVKSGGPGVLLRGSLPRMIEISVGGVLYFSAMTATKKALGWVDDVEEKKEKDDDDEETKEEEESGTRNKE